MGVVTVERNMKLKDKRYVAPHELMLYKPISTETKNSKVSAVWIGVLGPDAR